MQKQLLAILSCILSFMMVGGSYAQSAQSNSYHITSEQLTNFCKDTLHMMEGSKEYNVSRSSWCIGFIQGSVTAHRFYSAYYTLKNPAHQKLPDDALAQKIAESQVYCVPSSVNLGQLVRDVVKYLESDPKFQKEQASISVARALNQAYPC